MNTCKAFDLWPDILRPSVSIKEVPVPGAKTHANQTWATTWYIPKVLYTYVHTNVLLSVRSRLPSPALTLPYFYKPSYKYHSRLIISHIQRNTYRWRSQGTRNRNSKNPNPFSPSLSVPYSKYSLEPPPADQTTPTRSFEIKYSHQVKNMSEAMDQIEGYGTLGLSDWHQSWIMDTYGEGLVSTRLRYWILKEI